MTEQDGSWGGAIVAVLIVLLFSIVPLCILYVFLVRQGRQIISKAGYGKERGDIALIVLFSGLVFWAFAFSRWPVCCAPKAVELSSKDDE